MTAASRQQTHPTWQQCQNHSFKFWRNLSIYIDQSLTMSSHINIITGWCFRSVHQIRTILPSLMQCSTWQRCWLQSSYVVNWLLQLRLRWAISIQPRPSSVGMYNYISEVLKDDLHGFLWLSAFISNCVTVYMALHNLVPLYIIDKCVASTSVCKVFCRWW